MSDTKVFVGAVLVSLGFIGVGIALSEMKRKREGHSR